MVHSVELLFDVETDAAVRRIWDDLMDCGVRSQAAHRSPSNRPHVTLTVAERMDDAVTEALSPAMVHLPFDCLIVAPPLSGGRAITLARLVVPSAELLHLHTEVHRICLPHMADGVLPHAEPGSWTPHVTLARRLAPDKLAAALTLEDVGRDLPARAVGLRYWDGDAKREYRIG